jgi:cell division protein FtsI/penicillin-binding protein 2
MGQEIATTPLQLLVAHAALANDGRLVTPSIVRESEAPGAKTAGPMTRVVTPVVSEETARWIVTRPMTEVVSRGTGKQAAIDGYTVFGKTGTSQVVDPETGGYSHSRHVCSFVCGAPAQSPRAVVLVMVEEPTGAGMQFGGVVAAPASRDILESALRHLGVPRETEQPAGQIAQEPDTAVASPR